MKNEATTEGTELLTSWFRVRLLAVAPSASEISESFWNHVLFQTF